MRNNLAIFLVFFSTLGFSQERCGFSFGNKLKQLKNPNWIKKQAEFEYQLREFQNSNNGQNLRITEKIYRIPVVVHVVHNNASNFIGGTNNTNISDEQINSQIKVLNEDYRRKIGTNGFNSNPIGADMEIEFVLATKDPKGNATTGITRTYVAQQSFDLQYENEIIANLIHWDFEKYLNIWVVKSKNGTIGYSEFPYDSNLIGLDADAQSIAGQAIFDGVVIDFRNFGTCCGTLNQLYNLGRTTTHEIGHWLGLLHPTEQNTPCSDDYCNDTPQIERLNDGTTCNKLTSNCGGVLRTNLIEDYMDYSPDRCMNIFTNDQKNRTRAALQMSVKRQRLLLSLEPLTEKETLTVTVEPNPLINYSNLRVLFTGERNVKISVFDMRGILVYEDAYDSQKSTLYNLKTDKLRTGSYIVRIIAGNETSSQRIVIKN
jgi:Pregnancy-associated plasma protein-A/Secretion system C-terminal sorting domain